MPVACIPVCVFFPPPLFSWGREWATLFTTPLLPLQKEKVIVFCMSMYDLNLMVFVLAIHTVPPIPPPDPQWYAKQYKHEADINTLARASVHLGI